MSNTETWGIVLRDRGGAEQWIACEVTRDDRGRWRAKSVAGDDGMSYAFDVAAVESHARWIERTDATVAHARCVTREAYAAHMEGVCLTLAIDEANDIRTDVERLRAELATAFAVAEQSAVNHRCAVDMARHERETSEQLRASIANREEIIGELRAEVTRLADTLGAIGRSVGAESCDRDVILDAIRERGEDAFRRGAEAMREDAAGACVVSAVGMMSAAGAIGCDVCEDAIRALPLPVESAPQLAQSHEAPATPDAPLTIADAAATPRYAPSQRATCDHRWLATLDGLRFVCLRCPEVRQREDHAR